MRRKAKRDGNHAEIVKALRQVPGVTVADTAGLGDGFPDLVVGYKRQNFLFEVKDGKKAKSQRKLTKDEQAFHSKWLGSVDVVESLEDCLIILKVRA